MINFFLAVVLGVLTTYLMVSFIELEFNFTHWTREVRAFTVLFAWIPGMMYFWFLEDHSKGRR